MSLYLHKHIYTCVCGWVYIWIYIPVVCMCMYMDVYVCIFNVYIYTCTCVYKDSRKSTLERGENEEWEDRQTTYRVKIRKQATHTWNRDILHRQTRAHTTPRRRAVRHTGAGRQYAVCVKHQKITKKTRNAAVMQTMWRDLHACNKARIFQSYTRTPESHSQPCTVLVCRVMWDAPHNLSNVNIESGDCTLSLGVQCAKTC
jgi:hypothetical protein